MKKYTAICLTLCAAMLLSIFAMPASALMDNMTEPVAVTEETVTEAVFAEVNYCMECPDEPEENKEQKGAYNTMKKTIKIEGMMCMHCVKAATKALEAVEGVTAVNVSLDEKQAVVECADSVTDAALTAAITEEGFKVVEIA